MGAERVGGIKVFTDVPANGGRGLPTQQSTIVLVDLERGTPEAFLDGGSVTLYRTAAASAVATRRLARDDGATLGFVAWSRTPATVAGFARDALGHGPEVEILGSAQTAVEEAGNVVLAMAEGALTDGRVMDELGAVVIGARPGRTSVAEITLYNSIGVAIQDVATARLVVERARALGVGTEVALAKPLQERFDAGLWG
jgi:alanine dehydrogenase